MHRPATTSCVDKTTPRPALRLSERDLTAMRRVFEDLLPPGSTVYLFGSRTDPGKRGGDIDLLVHVPQLDAAAQRRLERRLTEALWQAIGEQKIDVVATPRLDSEASTFVQLVLLDAVLLWP